MRDVGDEVAPAALRAVAFGVNLFERGHVGRGETFEVGGDFRVRGVRREDAQEAVVLKALEDVRGAALKLGARQRDGDGRRALDRRHVRRELRAAED